LPRAGWLGGYGARIAVAVNADSMSTWFSEVFKQLPDVLFDNGSKTTTTLRDYCGEARSWSGHHRAHSSARPPGTVTWRDAPCVGCQSGLCRAIPDRGLTTEAAATARSLAWNRDDAVQDMLLRKAFRRAFSRPVHYVPTAEGFAAAVRAGLGWACIPSSSWPLPRWPMAPSAGSLMRTSMCSCIGGAGSWTALWSKFSPRRCGQPPQVCVGTENGQACIGLPKQFEDDLDTAIGQTAAAASSRPMRGAGCNFVPDVTPRLAPH
jgi:hypothetical protein